MLLLFTLQSWTRRFVLTHTHTHELYDSKVRWTSSWFPTTLTCLTLHYSKLIKSQHVSYLSVCFTKPSSTHLPLNHVNISDSRAWVASEKCLSCSVVHSELNNQARLFTALSWLTLMARSSRVVSINDGRRCLITQILYLINDVLI